MKLNRFHKIVLAALIAAQSFLAAAETTNTLAPSGYAKFIADRNIFDPNRVPNIPWVPHTNPPDIRVPRQPDSFSLVGVIGYGDGRLAGVHVFFDGSSSQYQKEAELNGTIANFKVAGISANSVKLVSGTNTMVLEIGEQLHDDTNGDWFFSNGTTVRYNENGNNRYGNYNNGYGGNFNRGGFGGRRRNNNFGNGGYGGYNNGNNRYGNYNNGYGGNFNRGRNNFDSSAATSDNSQAQDQNVTPSDGAFNPSQDNTPALDNSDPTGATTPADNNQ